MDLSTKTGSRGSSCVGFMFTPGIYVSDCCLKVSRTLCDTETKTSIASHKLIIKFLFLSNGFQGFSAKGNSTLIFRPRVSVHVSTYENMCVQKNLKISFSKCLLSESAFMNILWIRKQMETDSHILQSENDLLKCLCVLF